VSLDPNEFSAVVKARAGKVYPDLVNSLALRNLPKETAEAEGWPTYYMPSPCANGHTASRFVKNDLCIDCWRSRQKRETIYPTAKNRTYYKQRQPAAVGTNGTSAAPPAPLTPSKRDQRFLAELDATRDFDKAAAAVGLTRSEIESHASSDPVFRGPLDDLCTRRDIPRTRAADPTAFAWTSAKEKQFAARLVDCGLLEQVRQEMGVTASEFHSHLRASPRFSALIDDAEPFARTTLFERALASAEKGNDRLLKILEDELKRNPADVSMSHEEQSAQLAGLIEQLTKSGVFARTISYLRLSTNEIISADDLEEYETTHSRPAAHNGDLIGAQP
jgi:hypothetical protein